MIMAKEQVTHWAFTFILPVAIIAIAVLYLTWQEKQDNDIP